VRNVLSVRRSEPVLTFRVGERSRLVWVMDLDRLGIVDFGE